MTLADGWSRKFSEPIELPNGRRLVTLRDAIAWLAKSVPASEHSAHEVHLSAYCVTEAAASNGPMVFARIAVLRAINRHKPHHWGKRKLKRDQ